MSRPDLDGPPAGSGSAVQPAAFRHPGYRTAAADPQPPLPDGFGLGLDPSTRRIDGGTTLIGGSPLTALRLSDAGRRLLEALIAGEAVPSAPAANRLARRLLDLGLAHPRPPAGAPTPGVTVVIPVRDDPVGLATSLAGVGPAEQVLVVDDGSVDAAAVRRVVGESPRPDGTRVLRLERSRGPGGARQMGWEAAITEVVAFLDTGCQPEPGWVSALAPHLTDPAVAAVAPRVCASAGPAGPGWLSAYEAARSPLDLGPVPAAVRPRRRVSYVPTAALVVRRIALVDIGGFDTRLRHGEDVDLVWRLAAAGWVVRYEPSTSVGHAVRPDLAGLLRQRFDYGTSAALLADRHGDATAPLTTSVWSATAWLLALIGHPWLGLGVAATSTVALVPRLPRLDHPWREAIRLAGGGHLRAGRLIVEACRRTWWPLVTCACPFSGRARRIAVLGALLPPLLDRRSDRTIAWPAWIAVRLADDLAYGLGVWAGAARARSAAALRPNLTGWPSRRPPT